MKFINESRFPFEYTIHATPAEPQSGNVEGGGTRDVDTVFTVEVKSKPFGSAQAVAPSFATIVWGPEGGITVKEQG